MLIALVSALVAASGTSPAGAAEIAGVIPADCRQLVLVVAAAWDAPRATLQRYSRTDAAERWRPLGIASPVMLGEHGLAWGRGLHPVPVHPARVKHEGDRCAPAGVFRLTGAFGHGALNLRIPYRRVTLGTEAVDDPASRFYNQIVQRSEVARPDWKSSEHMDTIADYELGIIVAHNPGNIPGAGSCIFIHRWKGDRAGTAGCTAVRAPELSELARWLDATRHPVLVQLPRTEIPAGFP